MKEIKVTCKGVTKRVKLRELIALQKNLKVLTQDSYKKFKKNILRFGIMRPVVIWVKPSGEKCILDGHQLVNTLKVMENEGYTVPDLPVVEVEAKDEREAYARLLALASQYGELDTGGLYEVIETQVQDLQAVMQYFQFPRFDVDKFLREFYIDTDVEVIEDEETDVELFKEIKKKTPSVREGDVFLLGKHRVICGDVFDKNHIQLLMGDKKADLIIADPPYDLEDHSWFQNVLRIANPQSCQIFVWYSDKKQVELAHDYKDFFNYFLVMIKKSSILSSKMPASAHALIAYYRVGKSKFYNLHDAFSTCIYTDYYRKRDDAIPHMKPPSLFGEIIKHFSAPDDIIVDFFAGSGAVLMACETTSRRCYAIEKDPFKVEYILKRFQRFTGTPPQKIS